MSANRAKTTQPICDLIQLADVFVASVENQARKLHRLYIAVEITPQHLVFEIYDKGECVMTNERFPSPQRIKVAWDFVPEKYVCIYSDCKDQVVDDFADTLAANPARYSSTGLHWSSMLTCRTASRLRAR